MRRRLYIYISRFIVILIAQNIRYESNGKVNGKLVDKRGDIHNVIHAIPRIYSFLMDILIYRPPSYRLDTKTKPALKTRTLSNLKDELISEVEKTVLKSVSPMRPPPFSINAL